MVAVWESNADFLVFMDPATPMRLHTPTTHMHVYLLVKSLEYFLPSMYDETPEMSCIFYTNQKPFPLASSQDPSLRCRPFDIRPDFRREACSTTNTWWMGRQYSCWWGDSPVPLLSSPK